MVFPAHAGMNRDIGVRVTIEVCVPRTRGDEPALLLWQRGAHPVFPAHAGMNRFRRPRRRSPRCVPRTRGDEPTTRTVANTSFTCSPHTRG